MNDDKQKNKDYEKPKCDDKPDDTKMQPVGDSEPSHEKAAPNTVEPNVEKKIANNAKVYLIITKYYPTNSESLTINQGINSKVLQVVDNTKHKTVYILSDEKYLSNEKLPRKLTQRMKNFRSIIESKLWISLNEIQ